MLAVRRLSLQSHGSRSFTTSAHVCAKGFGLRKPGDHTPSKRSAGLEGRPVESRPVGRDTPSRFNAGRLENHSGRGQRRVANSRPAETAYPLQSRSTPERRSTQPPSSTEQSQRHLDALLFSMGDDPSDWSSTELSADPSSTPSTRPLSSPKLTSQLPPPPRRPLAEPTSPSSPRPRIESLPLAAQIASMMSTLRPKVHTDQRASEHRPSRERAEGGQQRPKPVFQQTNEEPAAALPTLRPRPEAASTPFAARQTPVTHELASDDPDAGRAALASALFQALGTRPVPWETRPAADEDRGTLPSTNEFKPARVAEEADEEWAEAVTEHSEPPSWTREGSPSTTSESAHQHPHISSPQLVSLASAFDIPLPFALGGAGKLPNAAQHLHIVDANHRVDIPLSSHSCKYLQTRMSKYHERTMTASPEIASIAFPPIPPKQFALSADPVLGLRILPAIEERLGLQGLYAVPCSLTLRRSRSAHAVDIPVSIAEKPMIGKIIVCLPSEFEGGSLDIKLKDHEMSFNFSASQSAKSKTYTWAFYRAGSRAVLNPVRGGSRVTVEYDVYQYQTDPPAACESEMQRWNINTETDGWPTQHDTALRELLSDQSFLPNGGLLGFGSSHEYPDMYSKPGEPLKLRYVEETPSGRSCSGTIPPRGADNYWTMAMRHYSIRYEMKSFIATLGPGDDPLSSTMWNVPQAHITWVIPPRLVKYVNGKRAGFAATHNPAARLRRYDEQYMSTALFAEIPPAGLRPRLLESVDRRRARGIGRD